MLADVKLYMWTSHLSRSSLNVRTKGRYLVRKVQLLTSIGKKLKAKLKEKVRKRIK